MKNWKSLSSMFGDPCRGSPSTVFCTWIEEIEVETNEHDAWANDVRKNQVKFTRQ